MGDYLFDKYRKELEMELEFIENQIKTLNERAATIRESLTPKMADEVDSNPIVEEEKLDIDEDEVKVETTIPEVEKKTDRPIGFDYNQPSIIEEKKEPAFPEKQPTVSEIFNTQEKIFNKTSSQKVESTAQKGLLNLRETLNEYPSSIDVVDTSKDSVKTEKKAPLAKPEFININDIEYDIVDPRAQAAEKQMPVVEQPVLSTEPIVNNVNIEQPTVAFDNKAQASSIMPGQNFIDNTTQNTNII